MKIRKSTSFTPKKLILAACAALLVSITTHAADLKTDDDKASYSMGASVGKHISSQIYTQVELGAKVNVDLVVSGFVDSLKAKSQLNDEEILSALNQRVEQLNAARIANAEKLAAENTKKGESYLAENKKKAGVTVTASGLQYQVLTQGTGNKPNSEDVVTVEYVGKLIDGTEFENTIGRKEPTRFALMSVIPGWEEGLKLMPMGSKYRFVIPANLAYGNEFVGEIPPQSTLVFEIELKNIEKPSEKKEARMMGMMPAH